MLYCVQMDVRVPHDVDPQRLRKLCHDERVQAHELRRQGKWRHLWRVAGRYAEVGIFDGAVHDERHAILFGLPLFPFWRSP